MDFKIGGGGERGLRMPPASTTLSSAVNVERTMPPPPPGPNPERNPEVCVATIEATALYKIVTLIT